MSEQGITTLPTPEGVEVCERGAGEDKVRVLMNHNGFEVKAGDITLAPYESRIEKCN